MKHDEMWEAHYHAQQAANDLLMAYAIKMEGDRISQIYTDNAFTQFQKMADALGYDLVKREDKQEAKFMSQLGECAADHEAA